MQQTKVTLSPKELELVTDAGWILTKNGIIEKVYELFGSMSGQYTAALENYPLIKADMGHRSPKISRGEQYEGLPWVMLDHPRNYESDNAFGIRSFFWWGNFCSITLQLSGVYQQKYAQAVEQMNDKTDWLICTGIDPWQHHLRATDFVSYAEWKGDVREQPFIKLARKIPLQQWNQLETFFIAGYNAILKALS